MGDQMPAVITVANARGKDDVMTTSRAPLLAQAEGPEAFLANARSREGGATWRGRVPHQNEFTFCFQYVEVLASPLAMTWMW